MITDLGTLGGKVSEAVALNELGHVVGSSADASGRERAFIWRDGKMIALRFDWAVGVNDADQVIGEDTRKPAARAVLWVNGRVRFVCFGWVTAVNQRGQVIGTTKALPFTWKNGKLTRLRLLGVGRGNATAINERGDVVGFLDTRHAGSHAVLWQGTRLIDLGQGRGANRAIGLNNRGQIVGYGHGPHIPSGAFLWENGKLTDLGTLGGTATVSANSQRFGYSEGRRIINDSGQVVGSSQTRGGHWHAFLWQHGRMRDLGTLPGRNESEAVALNDHGRVIANSFNHDGTMVNSGSVRAFVWHDGKATELDTLGGQQSAAIDINNHGQIAGWSTTKTGRKHAVLWTLEHA